MTYPHTVLQRTQYAVAVKRGRTTKFFYGEKLKECLAHLKPGERFVYAKYDRGPEFLGELSKNGRTISSERLAHANSRERNRCASRSSTTPTSPSTA